MKKYSLVLTILFGVLAAHAKVKTERVIYKEGESTLEGYVVYDTNKVKHKAPGVIIVHDWMGISDYTKMRAEQLAEIGYVAFVADIYGQGIRPKDAKEAGQLAGQYKAGDRKLLRARANAAYEELKKNKYVDVNKISATGYCFGGTTVLEMARLGLPLKGVVSFHGGLAANVNDAKNIKTKILVLHGAIDPFVPATEVSGFQKELDEAKVDYQFISYSGAVHAFTQKAAGEDITKGAAYNEKADKRSYLAAKVFLEEVNK